jgi:hypothetical protein
VCARAREPPPLLHDSTLFTIHYSLGTVAYELFARICVGTPLTVEAATAVHAEFVASLGLEPGASAATIFDRLRDDAPRHKLHEPDRVRYELALEAFLDARWDVDYAIGGVSPDGVFEPRRGYLFLGVRVAQFETTVPDLPPRAAVVTAPQWLRKGDMLAGSDLSKLLGDDARKQLEHAGRAFTRAGREILQDAIKRLRPLPVSRQHEPAWALCRWLVPSSHPAALARHGRQR